MSGQASSGDRPWSIVLASREVWPFVEGGGIGRYMWAAARALAPHADVSILTSSRWQSHHDELVRAKDRSLSPGVRFAFVDEPAGDLSPFASWSHLWSLRLLEGVARLHPGGGPDILEMADYQAEGFAAAHARRGHDPRLRNTTLAVGLHTSAEMCAVLDEQPFDSHLAVLAGLERFPLRFADVLLWPGGNTLERYADFYGKDALAPAMHRPLPAPSDLPSPAPLEESPESGPLRLLYLNRLQALKGITELVTAVGSLPDADLTLTVVGRETMTGPGGSSMRAHLEQLVAGDARIELRGAIPHAEVPAFIARHHVVVVPSRWESSPYVVREALGCNRPVIGTPVGWIPEAVRAGESGWLARSGAPDDLAAVLRQVLGAREALARMVAEGRPRAVFDELAKDERGLEAYQELLERYGRRQSVTVPAGADRLSVSALIACESGGGDPLPTLLSLEGQRDVSVRSVLVVGASGSFPGPGGALALADAVVGTPGSRWGRPVGWAAGLAETSDELVLLLPAGTILEPHFVRRAALVLAAEPGISWVSAFARSGTTSVDASPGTYRLPLADLAVSPSVALFRRTALEGVLHGSGRAPDEDMDLFGRLEDEGKYGVVLQEELVAGSPRRAA